MKIKPVGKVQHQPGLLSVGHVVQICAHVFSRYAAMALMLSSSARRFFSPTTARLAHAHVHSLSSGNIMTRLQFHTTDGIHIQFFGYLSASSAPDAYPITAVCLVCLSTNARQRCRQSGAISSTHRASAPLSTGQSAHRTADAPTMLQEMIGSHTLLFRCATFPRLSPSVCSPSRLPSSQALCHCTSISLDGYPNSSITDAVLQSYCSYNRIARNPCARVYFTTGGLFPIKESNFLASPQIE